MLNSDTALHERAIAALIAARPDHIEFAKVEVSLSCKYMEKRLIVRLYDEGETPTRGHGRYQVVLIRHGHPAQYGPYSHTLEAAFLYAPWDRVANL